MPRRRQLLPLLTLVGALAAPTAASAASTITEYSAGLTSSPRDITRAPGGDLWFTADDGVGTISPTGDITEYLAGTAPGFTAGQVPSHITAGPDGALWFTEEGVTGQIGRLDPATGTVTEYAVGITPNRQPTGIAKGSDGNLWFTERGGSGAIGRITPTGLISEYTFGLTPNSAPTDIVAGPDGNLWFTESAGAGAIGRIDPDTGQITEFSEDLTPNSAPSHIVAASSGKLFFTLANDPGRIGRIKTDGKIDQYTSGLTANSAPRDIAEGGDGAIWFTAGADPGRIGRLWPDSEQITEFTGGNALGFSADAGPDGIAKGPDGNVWFTENAASSIGRITVPPLADIDTPQGLDDGKTRLKARVAPNTQPTTYRFEWGPTSGYGEETTDLDAAAVAGPVSVSTDVQLTRDAHYHARVTATNASGTTRSSDKSFYVTVDGEVVKEKPAIKPPPSTSTVVVAQVPPTGTPAPIAPTQLTGGVLPAGAPVLGENVGVSTLSGSVRIKTPGAARYVALTEGVRVPVGSLIDTRRGRVVLRSALRHGRSQKGTFWGAVFQVRQRRRSRGMTDLHLRAGRFGSCRPSGTLASASALARETAGRRRRRVVRRLWGKDRHGRFRTHGRDSVATVRGTRWVTTDRCDGTLTRVTSGKVLVRDLRRHRSVLLTAGRAYLARHRQR
jgi:streptogramin lyase